MRGADISQPKLFVTKTVEDFVPRDHPLRALRILVFACEKPWSIPDFPADFPRSLLIGNRAFTLPVLILTFLPAHFK